VKKLDLNCIALGNLVPADVQAKYWDPTWPQGIDLIPEIAWTLRTGKESDFARPSKAFFEARNKVKVGYYSKIFKYSLQKKKINKKWYHRHKSSTARKITPSAEAAGVILWGKKGIALFAGLDFGLRALSQVPKKKKKSKKKKKKKK
jgi:hypothetical protein